MSQSYFVCNWRSTILTLITQHRINTIKSAMVFLTLQCIQHFCYEIINIEQLQLHISVIDCNRQIICNVVAEGSHCRIVIRSAPFAKQIREPIYQNFRTGLFSVAEHQVLSGFFTSAVLTIITANASGLDGG